MSEADEITEENYQSKVFRFQDRQAGVSVIYDHEDEKYSYNAYCLELKLLKELFTVECDYLEDALEVINDEFGSWQLADLVAPKKDCGSCAAKS